MHAIANAHAVTISFACCQKIDHLNITDSSDPVVLNGIDLQNVIKLGSP